MRWPFGRRSAARTREQQPQAATPSGRQAVAAPLPPWEQPSAVDTSAGSPEVGSAAAADREPVEPPAGEPEPAGPRISFGFRDGSTVGVVEESELARDLHRLASRLTGR